MNEIISAAVLLILIMDPLGNLPIFMSVLKHTEPKRRRAIMIRELLIALLVMFIFALTEGCNVGRPSDTMAPVFIGLSVSSIICLIAPLTQAGLNPARDFGPRLVSWLAGWGEAAFPDACCGGFFFVYILAPILGGAVAAYALTYVIEPLIKQGDGSCECEK